jgi:exodeoxyribonuclease V alpha subunit
MTLAHLSQSEFDALEREFGVFIASHGGEETGMAAAAVMRNVRLGHTCLDLSKPPLLTDELAKVLEKASASLDRHPCVGRPGETTPLLLDGERLYLHRYYHYELRAASKLRELAGRKILRPADLELHLSALFPEAGPRDRQRAAAEIAATRALALLSGGPGTGKTTTALRIVALMHKLHPALRIALAAPTGKAADRLEESIRNGEQQLPAGYAIPQECSARTLHRLLGAGRTRRGFRYNARTPLPLDLVIVDEASMIDLAMLSRLLEALAPEARLVLMGDHHQLTSVEAGAILGDMIAAAASAPLRECTVILNRNYRFSQESGIQMLCQAIRNGSVDESLQLLGSALPDVTWIQTEDHHPETIRSLLGEGYQGFLASSTVAEAMDQLAQFRFLCATRSGPAGTGAINDLAEELRTERHCPFRPIIISRNDYTLGLHNGDMGVLHEARTGVSMAHFGGREHLRSFPVAVLPTWEPAWALTVHRSQGSEFENVCCLLPARELPLLTRELLYTAASRARKQVTLIGSESILAHAVQTRTVRHSGLADRLMHCSESAT